MNFVNCTQRSSVWYNSRYLLKNVWLCKNSFRKPSNQKHKTNQNSWKPRQLLQKTDNRYSPNEILKGLISHVHVGKDCKKIIHIARQFIATYLLRNLVLRFHHHSSLELKYKISFTARGILKVNWQILKDSVWHFVSHIHTYIHTSTIQIQGNSRRNIFGGIIVVVPAVFVLICKELTINTESIFALLRMFAIQLSRSIFSPRRSVRTMYGRIVIETGHVLCIKLLSMRSGKPCKSPVLVLLTPVQNTTYDVI